MRTQQIAERFAKDVAGHRMTVLHEDGLYRHLRFRHPDNGFYWFDLVTWPGYLAISGDMDCFTFSRVEDMFTFFRGGRINPQYWAEKVRAGRESTCRYDEEYFRQVVREQFTDAVRWGDTPKGLGKAVREQILGDEEIHYEDGARRALDRFEYEGFRFSDTWEWDLTDWSYQFLWCCHAIQWGISVYDGKAAAPVVETVAVAGGVT